MMQITKDTFVKIIRDPLGKIVREIESVTRDPLGKLWNRNRVLYQGPSCENCGKNNKFRYQGPPGELWKK